MLRMLEREEAIEIAKQAVKDRYHHVPPVGMAFRFSDDWMHKLQGQDPGPMLQEAYEQYTGKWMVYFFCSWDSDELGLPGSLMVSVDDDAGSTKIVSHDLSPGE